MLTGQQIDRTRRLALRLAGIELFDRHRELLERRSRRLGVEGGAGFDALLESAELGDPRASRRVIQLVTTHFTGFFRHPWHFDIAAEHALWAVHRRGRARLWSAAAATGEEPYSLAMALIEVFQRDDPPATILATDISEETLAVARQGEYGEAALAALKQEQRVRFFDEGMGAARWRLAPSVRQMVEFLALNLVEPVWPIGGPFDVIFCRNVVMYLEAECRRTALVRMASLLAPDGVLIMDPVENPGRARHLFTPGKNGVYALRPIALAGATGGLSAARQFERVRL